MNDKVGRNDPCPCGSGKKYKQCCQLKKRKGLKNLKAKWISKPQENILDKTFSSAISEANKKKFEKVKEKPEEEKEGE